MTAEQATQYTKDNDDANEKFKSCRTKAETDFDYNSIMEELTSEEKDYYSDDRYREVYNNYTSAYNACVKSYNSDIVAINSKVPSFDETKWIEQNMTDPEKVEYSINFPSEFEYFALWINAKNDENNDIYNVGILKNDNYEKDEVETEVLDDNNVNEQSKEENIIKEEVKNPNTGVYSVCGISVLAILLLLFLRKKTFISKI